MTGAALRRHLWTAGAVGLLLIEVPAARAQPQTPAEANGDDVGAAAAEAPGEVVEIWDERPNKPFDRDTELRLTGEQLAARGLVDLADALDALPDLRVRAQGRGGSQLDLRGARKGAVKIVIDGVPVDEPYYGTFDLSSIPVTDIEQIRVSVSPSSPIDGAGGSGGLVEVHTRDAVGARLVRGHLRAQGVSSADVAATARSALGRRWALRGSASALLGARDYEVFMPDGTGASLAEDRRAVTGAARLEHRIDTRGRLVLDLTAQHRRFVPPPEADGAMDILVIDGETTGRAGLLADLDSDAVRLRGRVYGQLLRRSALYFADATLGEALRREHIEGDRAGAGFLVNRPQTPDLHLVASANLDTESARVTDLDGEVGGSGRSTMAEIASGAQWRRGRMRVDLAAGVAVPIGVGERPWPEAKLTVGYRPARAVTFSVTGARKGRLPSLRERYRVDIGNRALDPEMASFAEVAVKLQPAVWFEATLSSFVRDTDGMIRFDGERQQLINIDDLQVRGSEVRLEVLSGRRAHGGVSAAFADAVSPRLGSRSLDFLPQRRAAAWAGLGLRPGLDLRARIRYQSEEIDRGELLAAHTTADLSVAWRGGPLSAVLRVDNAFDTDYRDRANVSAPGRTAAITLSGEW